MGLTLLLLVLSICHGGEPTRIVKIFYMEGRGDFWEGLDECSREMNGLAIIESQQENDMLLLFKEEEYVWIGLWDNMNIWTWALDNLEFDNNNHFSLWNSSRPQLIVRNHICVAIAPSGYWSDRLCTEELPSVCFHERGQTKYYLVTTPRSWINAWKYCMYINTNLVSVRNLTENGNVSTLLTEPSWIGLHRGGWGEWYDKTPLTFINFRDEDMLPDQTSSELKNCVVASTNTGLWQKVSCDARYEYICQVITVTSEHIPEVLSTLSTNTFKLQFQAGTDLNDPRIHEQLLLQLRELTQNKLGHLKLHWVQTNGQVFHKKTEKKENDVCRDVT